MNFRSPVVFDTSFLTILLDNAARVPADPLTNRPYERAQERIAFLLEALHQQKIKVLVPTPALAEFMMIAHPSSGAYLEELKSSYRIEIVDFDEMAAIELAEFAIRTGKPKQKKRGAETWAKMQYDRQIIAIAIARKAQMLFSADEKQRLLAKRNGIEPVGLDDLPLPPPTQMELLAPPEKFNTSE